ncbi:MAG: rhodanese-related sulfurtransferase [Magnetovibrionaceae bacterium]
MTDIVVAAFYHFTGLKEPEALKPPLQAALAARGLKGTVLLAGEGVNGTLAGSRAGIDAALASLRALPGCAELEHKESHAETMPFYRLKVRLKKEIVTLGVPGIDPTASVGTYVAPEDWNDLIDDPDTVVIDTRNDYEVGIGTFKGALNPRTSSFRDLPEWFQRHRAELEGKKVAMFCTGGIRCEKATSYFKAQGIGDVFHLKGGILKYLEEVPKEESRWQGECFVFDYRISVGHGLELGDYVQCHACRWPVDAAGRASPNYVPGVSCDHCIDQRTDDQRKRYAERQAQVVRAEARGEQHVGLDFDALKAGRKASPNPNDG